MIPNSVPMPWTPGNTTSTGHTRGPSDAQHPAATGETNGPPALNGTQPQKMANRSERRAQQAEKKRKGALSATQGHEHLSAGEQQRRAGQAAKRSLEAQRRKLESSGTPLPDIDAFRTREAAPAAQAPSDSTKSWLQTCTDVVSAGWEWTEKSLRSVTLLPGAAAEPLTSKAGNAKPKTTGTKELTALEASIKTLREAGVMKILLAEDHTQSRNVNMIAQALTGAKAADPKVRFYRELSVGHQDSMVDTAMKSFGQRSFVVDNIVFDIAEPSGAEPEGAAAKKLGKALGDQSVSLRLLSFSNANRNDLQKFVDEKDFSIASAGIAHVLYEIESVNHVRIPWTGIIERIPAAGQLVPPQTPASQRGLYDGFDRAQAKQPSAVVLQNQIWSSVSRSDLHRYYLDQGFVIAEVPMGKTANVTIIAPAIALGPLKSFANQHSGKVSLMCEGIDGCEIKELHEDL